MSDILQCYRAEVSFCQRRSKRELSTETSHRIMFTCSGTKQDAVRSIVPFTNQMLRKYQEFDDGDWWLGCVKVSCYLIGPINAKGYEHPHGGFPFFEWKCDRYGSLEDHIEAMRQEEKI